MKDKAKKNEFKKKSFYFQDYDESKIIINNKNVNLVKVSLNRVIFLFFVFFSLVLISSIKIFHLSLSPEKNFFSRNIKSANQFQNPNIDQHFFGANYLGIPL